MTAATDRSDLEARVRTALRARAYADDVVVPHRFPPAASGGPAHGRPGKRVVLLAGAGAAAAGALVLVNLVTDAPDGTVTETGPSTKPEVTAPVSPAGVDGVQLQGLTGSRWFVLDLPDVQSGSVNRAHREPYETGLTLQAFRTDAGFSGPSLWATTTAPNQDVGFGEDHPDAAEVVVQGSPAYVWERGDVVDLGWPEGGVRLTAAHMTREQVLATAEGLRPRQDGPGWELTKRPEHLAETYAGPGGRAIGGEYAEWDYQGPDLANYELFATPGGQGTFEEEVLDWVVDAETVEALWVDGRPGLLAIGEGESRAVWLATDEVTIDVRTSEDIIATLQALRRVDEDAWLDHLPPDLRSSDPAP